MSLQHLALGALLVFAFVGCKPKKAAYAYPTNSEAAVTSDAVLQTPPVVVNPPVVEAPPAVPVPPVVEAPPVPPVVEAPPVVTVPPTPTPQPVVTVPPTPAPQPVVTVPPTPTPQPVPPVVELPCDGTRLVIATDKLGTAPLKAQVEFNETFQELTFTPTPTSSTLCLKGLKETEGSLLTVHVLRNNALSFIAKRANTAYTPLTTSRIIIDNCLIQAVPWDGQSHDGGCEWTISEIPHGAD